MANEHLKTALQTAGLQPDDLAEILEVDVKTVRRWLHGARPYPRHRTRIARALDTTELELWPELASRPDPPAAAAPAVAPHAHAAPAARTRNMAGSSPGDLVAAYPDRSHLEAPIPFPALQAAREQIDMLSSFPTDISYWRELSSLLDANTEDSCTVRLLFTHQPDRDRAQDHVADAELDPLIRRIRADPRVELRQTVAQNYETIIRADGQMFITLALWPHPAGRRPYLHLKHTSANGLFERFAAHLDAAWEHAQPAVDPPGEPGAEPTHPRRWPGRTT